MCQAKEDTGLVPRLDELEFALCARALTDKI